MLFFFFSGKLRCVFKALSCDYLQDSNFTNLVEEEVVDVVSEEGSQLALLRLTWPHVHLYLLDESEQNGQKEENVRSTSNSEDGG